MIVSRFLKKDTTPQITGCWTELYQIILGSEPLLNIQSLSEVFTHGL